MIARRRLGLSRSPVQAAAVDERPAMERPPLPRSAARDRSPALNRARTWLDDDTPEAIAALLVLGGVMELFLVLLANRFWLTKFFPGPGVSVGFPQMMSGDWGQDARWLVIVLTAPFVAYVAALRYLRGLRSRLAVAIVFGYAIVFALTLVGLYPIMASDLFHYLADARTLVVHQQNPMQVSPERFPFIIGISWAQQPSPYGPLWQLLAAIPLLITRDYTASIIGLKVLSVAFYLLSIVLVYLTVRRTWPGRELFAAAVFAWNPFIVFRAVGNGHNDLVMMAFALAALYFAAIRLWRFALPLLALSIAVKYSTALLVPLFLVYAWQSSSGRGRRQAVEGAVIGCLVTVAVFFPFWRGADTFKTFIQNTNLVITAVPQLVSLKLQSFYTAGGADQITRVLGYLVFGAVYLALLVAIGLRPTFNRLVAACALAFVAYLTCCTWWFRPWYFLWFLALTPLLPSLWWTVLALGVTIGSTYFDLIEQYRVHWGWVWSNAFRAYAAPVFAAFAPLLAILFLGLLATGAWTMLRPREDPPMALDD